MNVLIFFLILKKSFCSVLFYLEYITDDNLEAPINLCYKDSYLNNVPFHIRYTENIASLDLSSNNIREFPSEFRSKNCIKYLNLENNDFIEISNEITNLDNLRVLNMNNNSIHYLKSNILKLVNLEELYLKSNKLENIVCLNLKYLRVLDLEENNIFNPKHPYFNRDSLFNFFYKIEKVENLENLNISKNSMFTHEQSLKKLKKSSLSNLNIKELYMEKMDLDSVPIFIYNCSNLEYLSLGRNNLTQFHLNSVLLETIIKLDIRENYISEIFIEESSANKLTELILRKNQLTEIKSKVFFKELKVLDISENCLTSIPEFVYFSPKLEVLNLSENKIKVLPSSLFLLSNIKVLNVSNNDINFIHATIPSFRSLVTIDLSFNPIKNIPHGIINIKASYMNFSYLELRTLGHFEPNNSTTEIYCTNNNLTEIPQSLVNLKNLKILNLKNNKISKIPIDLWNMNHLKVLNISNNNIGHISLSFIFSRIKLIADKNPIPSLSSAEMLGKYEIYMRCTDRFYMDEENFYIDFVSPQEIIKNDHRAYEWNLNAIKNIKDVKQYDFVVYRENIVKFFYKNFTADLTEVEIKRIEAYILEIFNQKDNTVENISKRIQLVVSIYIQLNYILKEKMDGSYSNALSMIKMIFSFIDMSIEEQILGLETIKEFIKEISYYKIRKIVYKQIRIMKKNAISLMIKEIYEKTGEDYSNYIKHRLSGELGLDDAVESFHPTNRYFSNLSFLTYLFFQKFRVEDLVMKLLNEFNFDTEGKEIYADFLYRLKAEERLTVDFTSFQSINEGCSVHPNSIYKLLVFLKIINYNL